MFVCLRVKNGCLSRLHMSHTNPFTLCFSVKSNWFLFGLGVVRVCSFVNWLNDLWGKCFLICFFWISILFVLVIGWFLINRSRPTPTFALKYHRIPAERPKFIFVFGIVYNLRSVPLSSFSLLFCLLAHLGRVGYRLFIKCSVCMNFKVYMYTNTYSPTIPSCVSFFILVSFSLCYGLVFKIYSTTIAHAPPCTVCTVHAPIFLYFGSVVISHSAHTWPQFMISFWLSFVAGDKKAIQLKWSFTHSLELVFAWCLSAARHDKIRTIFLTTPCDVVGYDARARVMAVSLSYGLCFCTFPTPFRDKTSNDPSWLTVLY